MRIIRLLVVIAVLLLGVVAGQTLGYDARSSLTILQEELTPFVTEAHNLEARYCGENICIKQLVPFSNQLVDYGERRATLVIDLQELKFERVAGWDLLDN